MLYIHDTRDIQLEMPSIVTIGKFDGFHRGHARLLQAAGELRGDDHRIVLFTFSRSPQMVMAGRRGLGLDSHEEKIRRAEAMGVDVLIEYPFTEEVRRMTAEDFLAEVLMAQLHATDIIAGPDCSFGYERRGNVEFLRAQEAAFGYRTHVIQKEEYRWQPISSTRIREELSLGHVRDANRMLGYPFGYRARVLHGKQLGRTMGFPTINQQVPEDKVVPALGVYASEVFVDGRWMPAVSNVGRKPTIPGEFEIGIETSIFDYSGDLYEQTLEVHLLEYIRPERKFSSLDSLRRQVDRDKETAREYFRKERTYDGT